MNTLTRKFFAASIAALCALAPAVYARPLRVLGAASAQQVHCWTSPLRHMPLSPEVCDTYV